MFIVALSTVAKLWKNPKCPLTDKWIKKMWHIYTMEHYTDIKKNEILPGAPGWLSMEPDWDSLSPSLSLSAHRLLSRSLSLSLSLSQNKWRLFKKKDIWVAWSVEHLTLGLGSGHDLMVSWVQALGQALLWQCREPAWDCLPPSLSAPPPLMLTHSLSQMNKL